MPETPTDQQLNTTKETIDYFDDEDLLAEEELALPEIPEWPSIFTIPSDYWQTNEL